MRSLPHHPHVHSFREPTRKLLIDINAHLTQAIASASCHPCLGPVLDGLFALKRDVVRFELERFETNQR